MALSVALIRRGQEFLPEGGKCHRQANRCVRHGAFMTFFYVGKGKNER